MLIFGAFVLQIQVGVEFEASTRTQETTTSFGYQMELPEANMVFRGRYLSLHILVYLKMVLRAPRTRVQNL